MKDIYELLNNIDIDENEFEEMEVSDVEKARVKKFLKKSIGKNNKDIKIHKKAIKVASCGLICLGILSAIIPAYANETSISEVITKTIDTIRGYFETNESGETYGTYIDKGDGEFEEPDLMAVVGENNVEGYVRKADLYDEANQPNNPEEAIAYMKKREEEGPRIIPVYKEDGKTIIGEFIIH